ncbi:MAG: NosD domain-containing protein [Planctomycetota bacterium]|jgi:parallel beta-helix repeat protein
MKNSSTKKSVGAYLLLAVAVLTYSGSAASGATYLIPDDTSIGTWVPPVFTLNTDVSGTIQVNADNMTLDGAGHTVNGPGDGWGVLLIGRTGVTVENVNVDGFVYGILVNTTSYSTISCNVTSNNQYGIRVGPSSPWNVLTGNTVSSSSPYYGISLYKSGRTIVSENTMSNNAYGMRINQANNGDINNNNFIDNTVQATIASATGNVFNLNHWSDWTTPDNDSDGIVDNPYNFTGGVDPNARVEPVPSPCTQVLGVDIDIKPGSYPNAINLGSYGLVPVAILSSQEFDATTVDPDTVELAGADVAVRGKSNKYMAHEEDVNADGLVDLVTQVATQNLDPGQFQDGSAVLTGATYDGQQITGTDEVTIVPPE